MGCAGDRIKKLRLQNHLTQNDVSSYLGIGKQAVYKYETGTVTNIPLENIEKMAKLFGTSPAYLAGWGDDPTEQLSDNERRLVTAYREADDRARVDALKVLLDHKREDPDTASGQTA